MKRISIISLILAVSFFSLTAAEVILPAGSEANRSHGISLAVDPAKPVMPVFNLGRVTSVSSNPQDSRNFGSYVEVESVVTYKFKGEEHSDRFFLVYANLGKVLVEPGQVVELETVLGGTGGPGTAVHQNTGDLYIYLYSLEYSVFLDQQSKSQYFEENGVYWWNPLPLISQTK